MAFFSTKLQIPCKLLSQQSNKSSKYNARNFVKLIPPSDLRNFWSWSSESKAASKEDRRRTVCGKKLPERLNPCNPECASKCIQIEKCRDNEAAKKKLTNCRQVGKTRTKLKSYWTNIFGGETSVSSSVKKKSPDTCTCRVVNYEKRIARERDPRLRDPRYEMTDGDVFIFTERSRKRNRMSREPLPKPPPSYKVPKAVTTGKFVRQMEETPNNCATAWQFEASCDDQSPKCSGPTAPILPFEELRPPASRRTVYSCKDGVRPEVAYKPPRNNSYCCGGATFESNPQRGAAASSIEVDSKNFSLELSLDIHSAREKSRFEQLKKLTRAKEGSRCCEPLSANIPEKTNFSHSGISG